MGEAHRETLFLQDHGQRQEQCLGAQCLDHRARALGSSLNSVTLYLEELIVGKMGVMAAVTSSQLGSLNQCEGLGLTITGNRHYF